MRGPSGGNAFAAERAQSCAALHGRTGTRPNSRHPRRRRAVGLTPAVRLRHGVHDNVGFVFGSSVPTLAERFREAGYRTQAFVSGFPLERRFGLARGFEGYDDRFTRGGDAARPAAVERRADETVAAVDTWLREDPSIPERPLFLWIHFFDPHAPYEPPDPFKILKPEQLQPLAPVAMAPVGRYAYKITWSDGHDTGIFTLEHLRSLCECPECQNK